MLHRSGVLLRAHHALKHLGGDELPQRLRILRLQRLAGLRRAHKTSSMGAVHKHDMLCEIPCDSVLLFVGPPMPLDSPFRVQWLATIKNATLAPGLREAHRHRACKVCET